MKLTCELQKVTFQYEESGKVILDNLNFKVLAGEVFLLTGASGDGKSTLMNILNGMISHRVQGHLKGKILFENEVINELKPVERSSKIGTVMQNADEQIIYPQIEDELAFALENQGLDRQNIQDRITKILQKIELDPLGDTKKLSGGEKQRLITGATLVMDQKLIILDEPLANLDNEKAMALMESLRELAEIEGKSIVIIEHRLELVLPYVHRVGWLSKGKVHVYDDVELFKNEKLNHISVEGLISKESEKTLISLKNISLKRGKKILYENFSWDLKEGSHWIIEGKNGCGKTSLLELMLGLLKPTKGEVDYGFPKNKRFEKIGMVLQNPNYQLFMPSVYEEVLFECKNRSLGEYLLKELGLWEYRDRHPQSLSEGQKRRLGVAVVLAREPEIIFFDEPTVGQDMAHLEKMMELLLTLYKDKKMTTVTITHDRRYTHCMGDQVLNLDIRE